MKITSIETFVLHVPVTGAQIADSTHRVSHWGVPGVRLGTDDGHVGYGYTGTHGHLATDRLIVDCIAQAYGPLLLGRDPSAVVAIWNDLVHHPPIQWVGRGGITHLALAAIDVALWDLKAKALGQPLWQMLGGAPDKVVEAYNTDGGWLSLDTPDLVAQTVACVAQGFRGVKIKVGSPALHTDLERIAAVRHAIGEAPKLMVDANGRWDLPTAQRFVLAAREFDLGWLEEPVWYDDVRAHARLAGMSPIPIALGEQLYLLDHFRQFIDAGALHYVQPDAVRLAGITEWLQVADLALAARLPVVSHVGDMMQVHLQLAFAHPSTSMLEYIPWLRECFADPATVAEGRFLAPTRPGAGTTLRPGALRRYRVA